MTIGKAIKTLREKKGMSVHEVALRSGISDSHLYNIEADLRLPPRTIMENLALVFDVPIVFFEAMLMDFKEMGPKTKWKKGDYNDVKEILQEIVGNYLN